MSEQVKIDQKEQAAHTFANVIEQTRDFFPDSSYRPQLLQSRTLNAQFGINPAPHKFFANSDGIGTKPELAERLFNQTQDYRWFETIAFDGVAMVVDDAARFGYFVLGLVNNIDVNSAEDPAFISALASGLYSACQKGRFPLLNGETAELGYRTPGLGKARLNWNLTALPLINEQKIIDGSKLKPGQPIVAFRETSIRSNGLTRARAILENAYLQKNSKFKNKQEFIAHFVREKLGQALDQETIIQVLSSTPVGSDIWDFIHVPWHESFEQETGELLKPSTIYAPLIYEAQGGVDGAVQVPLTACAHISGGGIPLKGKRMVENQALGMEIDPVFPDPEAVQALIRLAEEYPDATKGPLVNQRTASEQWNRGIGFLCVTPDISSADYLVELAGSMGYEAKRAGIVLPQKKIQWRDETWIY